MQGKISGSLRSGRMVAVVFKRFLKAKLLLCQVDAEKTNQQKLWLISKIIGNELPLLLEESKYIKMWHQILCRQAFSFQKSFIAFCEMLIPGFKRSSKIKCLYLYKIVIKYFYALAFF